MKMSGPTIYSVSKDGETSYELSGSEGEKHFHGSLAKAGPKIYVYSHGGSIIYVGITRQTMAARISLGINPKYSKHYRGYKFFDDYSSVTLHVWCLSDLSPIKEEANADLQKIECEVVYLYRYYFRQWPKSQTGIHFAKTEPEHRRLAMRIFKEFYEIY
jgi:hypothetical protein